MTTHRESRRPTYDWAVRIAEGYLQDDLKVRDLYAELLPRLEYYRRRYPRSWKPRDAPLYEFIAESWVLAFRALKGDETSRALRRLIARWLPRLKQARRLRE